MSEYSVSEKTVFTVIEITDENEVYEVAEFDNEEEAEKYKQECEG